MWNIFIYTVALLTTTAAQSKIPRNTTTYQITENIDDIPDDRTLAPIDPTYGIQVPLNFINNTASTDTGTTTTTTHMPIVNPYEVPDNTVPANTIPVNNVPANKPNPGTYEVNEKPNEIPNQSQNQKNNTRKENVKKNSFSILHIKGEFENDDKGSNSNVASSNNVSFKGFLDGLRSYLYSMKKGLVDGLYNWYHKDQARKEIDKFYRSFNKDDDEGPSDDEFRNWIHKDEVQKEINDFYKHFNDESDDESGPDDDEKVPDVPKGVNSGPEFDVENIPDSDDKFTPNGPNFGDNETDDDEIETGDDEIDIRYSEPHDQEYDQYDDYHYHHRRHGKFGDCK